MAKSQILDVQAAELTPERAIREIRRLLSDLGEFSRKNFRDGEQEEDGWRQKTENVFKRTFSGGSHHHNNLLFAANAGLYNVHDSPQRKQENFISRMKAYQVAIETAIADIEMSLPEAGFQGVYEGGEQYEFCRDVRGLMRLATRETLIIDPYLDPELFDVYVDVLPSQVAIHVLTANPKPNVTILSQKFASGCPNFEMRVATTLHDRVIFIDDRCWVIGQSMKNAAKEKPTYIVEHSNELMRKAHQPTWDGATSIVKS